MKSGNLLPGKIKPENSDDLQNIFKNIIYLTNYFPALRTGLGWKGIFRIAHERECWTIKIKSRPGVYGIIYDRGATAADFIFSSFALFYFPDPEEDIIESISLNGALLAQQEDYISLIREFPYHSDFYSYYHIGDFYLSYSINEASLFAGVQGLSKNRIVADDGVKVPGEDKYVVMPGEAEQDFPAFDYCLNIFDVLASSLSYQLKESPGSLYYRTDSGFETRYSSEGNSVHKESDDISVESLILGFGSLSANDKNFSGICGIKFNAQPLESLIWKSGEVPVPERFADAKWWSSSDSAGSMSMDKSLLGISHKPPLYVVSGFLGSGKTTFIRNFIEFQSQKYLFTAVIQNELGEIGLDGAMLSGESKVLEMDEGCVCCTLSGNLRKGIKSILEDFSPDCIILETTGAANPANLIDEIGELNDLVRFDSVTSVVDCDNIAESVKRYPIASEQIKSADVIVLNKLDIAGEVKKTDAEKIIKDINKRALLVDAVNGVVNPSLIYNSEERITKFTVKGHHHHDHLNEGIESVSIRFTESFDRDRFREMVSSLDEKVFRVKGIVDFSDSDRAEVFQYVCGRYDLTPSDIPADTGKYLVFIGKELEGSNLGGFSEIGEGVK